MSIDRTAGSRLGRRAGTGGEAAHGCVPKALRLELVARAELEGDEVVLELGCGTGAVALGMAARARAVISVDQSPEMLARLRVASASRGLRNVDAVLGDLRSIPLPDASVDVAVSCYALHHLSNDDKDLVLAEIRRALRPGGRLVIVDMMLSIGLDRRDRRLTVAKLGTLPCKGPGFLRIARNAGRNAGGRLERPANIEFWHAALSRCGYCAVAVEPLINEAGCAVAKRPF